MSLVDEPLQHPLDDRGPEPTASAEPGAPEPSVEEAVAGEAVLEERRYPSTIGGACYIVVMLVVVGGLGFVALGRWRLGIQVVAGALAAMALMRLVLPQRDAGMLAVRHRLVDAALLAGSAGLLLFLTATIPNQPG